MKIDRPNIDIQPFAGSSKTEERTAFGSKEITDNLEKNLNADFARGWGIVPVSELPTMQDFNAVAYTISALVTHLYQNGIAEYAASQTYNKGAWCLSGGEVYTSLTDNNQSKPVTDKTQWVSLKESLLLANIVQQTGTATDRVISQKGVTDELGKKLAKDQNGADIPNKDTFIKNLGLAKLLDKKFDKTGGTVSGQVDIASPGGSGLTLRPELPEETSAYIEGYLNNILKWWVGMTGGNLVTLANIETGKSLRISNKFTMNSQLDVESAGGRVQTLKATAGTSVYQEFYLISVLAAWMGITNGDTLTLANSIANKRLTIGPDGFKIDGRDIAATAQLLGVEQTYKDVTASRKNGATYTNNSTKPIWVFVKANRTASPSDGPYSIGVFVNGVEAAYRWTSVNEIPTVQFIVPPGASYYVLGGWGQTHPLDPITKWVELS